MNENRGMMKHSITLKRILMLANALVLIAALCLVYGFYIEPRLLKIRQVTITAPASANIPAPLRIGLLSDIHLGGAHVTTDRLKRAIEAVNENSPDIILIAGDFIDGHERRDRRREDFNARIDEGLLEIGTLRAPMGVHAAMGNHDSYYSQSYVTAVLEEQGVHVLVNSARREGGYCIVGLADAHTSRGDPAAFDGCDTGDAVIGLMHSPNSFEFLRADTVIAVAGHTHGGQINLPILGRAVTSTKLGKPYAYGHKKWKGIDVFITAGIGTSILPARFRAPPEVVIIDLVQP